MCEIFEIELSRTAFASQSRFIFFDEEDDYKFLVFKKIFENYGRVLLLFLLSLASNYEKKKTNQLFKSIFCHLPCTTNS